MLPVTCSFILALYLYLSILSKMKVSAMPVRYKTCGGTGTVQSLELTPCTEQPCVFHHGVDATVGLNFTSGSNSSSLKTEVFGLIGGIPISFPMKNPDACTNCGLTCPVESGQSYAYNNTLPVLKQYPSLRVVVKWQLVGDNDDIVACVLFPIAIESEDSNPIPEFHDVKPKNPQPDPEFYDANSKKQQPVPESESEYKELDKRQPVPQSSILKREHPKPAEEISDTKRENLKQVEELDNSESDYKELPNHRSIPELYNPKRKNLKPVAEFSITKHQNPKPVQVTANREAEFIERQPIPEYHKAKPEFLKSERNTRQSTEIKEQPSRIPKRVSEFNTFELNNLQPVPDPDPEFNALN